MPRTSCTYVFGLNSVRCGRTSEKLHILSKTEFILIYYVILIKYNSKATSTPLGEAYKHLVRVMKINLDVGIRCFRG
jgi:hypothetical protein